MAHQGLFKNKDSKLYFKKNHATMTLLDKVKHPLFYDWFDANYPQIARRYNEINADKKYSADKVWCYFSNESYDKIKKELGVSANVIDFGLSSREVFLSVANNDYYEQEIKRERLYRKDKNILNGFKPMIKI